LGFVVVVSASQKEEKKEEESKLKRKKEIPMHFCWSVMSDVSKHT